MSEIDLDHTRPWLQMGARNLRDKPWLVADSLRLTQLALKHRLLEDNGDDVFRSDPIASDAESETLALVTADLERRDLPSTLIGLFEQIGDGLPIEKPAVRGPLDIAGRLIQEDLCLLRREAHGWVFRSATLCFPSRWRLADKIGRPLTEVHTPVDGYSESLADRVTKAIDGLGTKTAIRRNWFVHPDPTLFQPQPPVGGDELIEADRCSEGLVIRSERQTLRLLPESRWCLFTIRTQQGSVGQFVAEGGRRQALRQFLVESKPSDLAHRGMSQDQVLALLNYL